MRILCPLRACSEIEPLARAGARYFYAGVDSAVLFGPNAAQSPIINCRPWRGCNFDTGESLRAACELTKRHEGRLYLTFNWHAYRSFELEAILDFLGRHEDVDGVVVADTTLLTLIHRRYPRLRLLLGTVAHVENSRSVEFFRKLGVKQIVLPRHLTLEEIGDIVSKHPSIDFEVFIKNQDCFFSQGLCFYTHDVIDASVPYQCNSVGRYLPSRDLSYEELGALRRHQTTLHNSCGVCAIQELSRAKVTAVKLVGRELPLERKLVDFAFIKRAIDGLDSDRESFRDYVRDLHREIFGVSCKRDCMY